MAKKFLLVFALVCTLILVFSSCSETNPPADETSTESKDTVISEDHVHAFGEWTIAKEATCVESGEKERLCTCGEKQTETISVTDHTFGDWATVNKATCVEAGTEERSCSVCGHAETKEIGKIDHNYVSKVTKAATCTDDGTKALTCSICNDVKTETIKKTGHKYSSSVTTAPTCSSNGVTTYKCSTCGNSYTETISASEHNWVDATCRRAKYCANCNLTSGKALGHILNSGVCSRCGKNVIDEAIAAENQYHEQMIIEINTPIDTEINSYKRVIQTVKSQLGISILYSESYYLNRQRELQTEITNAETRLAYLRRDTSGANKLEILQLEKKLESLRAEYSNIYLCLDAARMQGQIDLLEERRQLLIRAENERHNKTLAEIRAQYS